MPDKLEKIWIPPRPGFTSLDSEPHKPVKQKIIEIKKSRVRISKSKQYGSQEVYEGRLCHTKGLSFRLDDKPNDLSLMDFDVGDKRLYGHGIGARMLERAIAYGLSRNPELETVSRTVGNWALLRTMGKVLGGDEQLSFEKGGQTYGYGSDRPIESVFDDFPYADETQDYMVSNLVGHIDEGQLMARDDAERAVSIYRHRH